MQGVYPRITVATALLLPWISPRLAQAQAPPAAPAQEQPAAPVHPPREAAGEVRLKPATLEDSDLPLPINLATALRLADARPLTIAAAQAGVWVAEAQLQRAQLLWVPTLNIGFDYIRHDGFGPDFNRGLNTPERPLNQNINFLYAGGGLTASVALTDAVFSPLSARQVLNSRRFDIQTAKNDALFETAAAYFNVHKYRGMYAGANDTVDRGRKLVERVDALSKDLVPKVEIARAKKLLADLEQQATSAREEWRVASADLTQVLRLDPRAVIVPLEHDHLQITLIEPSRTLDDLIPIGLTNRPELASQQALVQAVLVKIRQEKLRPLTPSILLNGFQTPNELLQFGAQGIGSGKSMNNWMPATISARRSCGRSSPWAWATWRGSRSSAANSRERSSSCSGFRTASPATWPVRRPGCSPPPLACSRPNALSAKRSSPTTATTRVCARPSASATCWCRFFGRRKRSPRWTT